VTSQVPVDRRASDAELRRDLADGVRAPAVDGYLVVRARGDLRLRMVNLGFWPHVCPRARASTRRSRVRSNSAIAPRI